MTKILIIGAGRSATSLIDYLLKQAEIHQWQITVADVDKNLALLKTKGHPEATAIGFDIQDETERQRLIKEHDLVISMLPAFMHGDVAKDCVAFGKHLATASYISKEMKELDEVAKQKGIILLNECGLDPGLDHASGMKIIDEIKAMGAEIETFKSYCGGLVAPESNDNPWGYKFSWNPRNVILAGQGTAQFLEDGQLKFIPYSRLFAQTESVKISNSGTYDAYANRDSISYIKSYGLDKIKTMIRGTLRQEGYCKAWNVFVSLGLTDDSFKIQNTDRLNYGQLIGSFLPKSEGSIKERLKSFVGSGWDRDIEDKMESLGLFSNLAIELKEGSPAQLLQDLLEKKWKLQPDDKDMIVLQHQFEYKLPGEKISQKRNSSLVVIGKDQQHTAMALTVGLPLAITVKNILTQKIKGRGVQIPITKEIYDPMLIELEGLGIKFTEE